MIEVAPAGTRQFSSDPQRHKRATLHVIGFRSPRWLATVAVREGRQAWRGDLLLISMSL